MGNIDFPLKQVLFPEEQYRHELHEKKQIVLHHTVSGAGVTGDIQTWLSDPRDIATSLIFDRKGTAHQCFYTGKWSYHLGCGNSELDKHSIGIEIDSWGALAEKNGLFFPINYIEKTRAINEEDVQVYPKKYRGYRYFEKYTDKCLELTRKALVYLCDKYGIPKDYNDDIWGVNQRALAGEPGIFTHASYRGDKSDCHPQPELVEVLKSL